MTPTEQATQAAAYRGDRYAYAFGVLTVLLDADRLDDAREFAAAFTALTWAAS